MPNSKTSERHFRSITHTRGNEEAQDQAAGFTAAGHSIAWRRIWTIARNAFREAVRDRVLCNLVLFVLLLIMATNFFSKLLAVRSGVTQIVN